MTDLYLCDISDFDFSQSGKLLPYLPLEKRFEVEQMADTNTRRCRMISYFILYSLLKERQIIPNGFCFNSAGKPYLKGFKNLFFNISYADTLIAIAVSDKEVGVDIEKKGKIGVGVARHFFSEKEIVGINACGNPSDMANRIWTMKESFVKMLGNGLNIPLDAFSIVIDESHKCQHCIWKGEEYFFKEYAVDDYDLTMCSQDMEDFPSVVTPINIHSLVV